QDGAGESEVLGDQGRRTVGGVGGDGVEGQPGAQHGEVLAREQLGGGGDVLGLAHGDHVEGGGGGGGALDVGVPGEGGGELSALRGVHRVVGLLPVAQAHHVHVAGREARLEIHHRVRDLRGITGDEAVPARQRGELGELREVGDIGLADRRAVVLAVEALIRRAQSALVDLHLVGGGVVVVGPHIGQHRGGAGIGRGHHAHHILEGGGSGDGGEQVVEDADAGLLDRVLVHEHAVQRTHPGVIGGGDLLAL